MAQLQTPKFYLVGEIENLKQLVAELRIAGDRLLIQSGIMKEWSDRFNILSDSLLEYLEKNERK